MDKYFADIDQVIRRVLAKWAVPLLRVSLGIVFVWFGALKVFDVTPVTDLVAETVYWVDPDWFVPLLGWVEVAVGLALILRRGLRLVLPVFLSWPVFLCSRHHLRPSIIARAMLQRSSCRFPR